MSGPAAGVSWRSLPTLQSMKSSSTDGTLQGRGGAVFPARWRAKHPRPGRYRCWTWSRAADHFAARHQIGDGRFHSWRGRRRSRRTPEQSRAIHARATPAVRSEPIQKGAGSRFWHGGPSFRVDLRRSNVTTKVVGESRYPCDQRDRKRLTSVVWFPRCGRTDVRNPGASPSEIVPCMPE